MALRIKKKYIDSKAIDGSKIELLAGEAVTAVDLSSNSVIDLIKVDAQGKILAKNKEIAFKEDLDLEITARIAGDLLESSSRQAADLSEQSSRVAANEAETSSRIAGDLSEQSSRVAADLSEQSSRIAGDLAEQSSRVAADDAESTARAAADLAEQSSREAADLSEQSSRVAGDSSVLTEAKGYTDSEISTRVAALLNGAPEILDTLKEIADAIGNDADFFNTISESLNSIRSSVTEEESRATAAEISLSSAIQALETTALAAVEDSILAETSSRQAAIANFGDNYVKETVIVDSTVRSAGYLDLTYKAFTDSMVVAIDRLMMFEGEDYTVSEDSGKTRLTFINSLLPGGEEELADGDKIRAVYLRDLR